MILILAEHNNSSLSSATRSAVTAATQIASAAGTNMEIHILVAGHNAGEAAAQAAGIAGVSKVLHADAPHYAWPLPENIAPLVASIGRPPSVPPAGGGEVKGGYSHILATATTTGKDIMPRAAALLDTVQVSDIISVLAPDTFRRPIYAGNAIETVKAPVSPLVVTVRQSAFSPAFVGGAGATIETLAPLSDSGLSSFVALQASTSDRPELASARVVVSGGRGMGSAENFKRLEPLADKLGAAIGASRAAVDAGFVSNDYQVGQTGKIVAPELYVAVAISGAIQHLAGMKDSKTIVAINKDENAPIFEVADYGLVGEWETVLPELLAVL